MCFVCRNMSSLMCDVNSLVLNEEINLVDNKYKAIHGKLFDLLSHSIDHGLCQLSRLSCRKLYLALKELASPLPPRCIYCTFHSYRLAADHI
jgi:hypothetical protein